MDLQTKKQYLCQVNFKYIPLQFRNISKFDLEYGIIQFLFIFL